MRSRARVVRGDWQTPSPLARDVAQLARSLSPDPRAVVEPTCGSGALLAAADDAFGPAVALHGFEIDEAHAAVARLAVPRADVRLADAFTLDWESQLAELPTPLLVLGNPPWVSTPTLGKLAAPGPARVRVPGAGLAARTGRGSFDVSEWLLLRLAHALAGRDATFVVLCKRAVARRLLASDASITPLGLWHVDAGRHFAAAVSACVLAFRTDRRTETTCPVHERPGAPASASLGRVDGALVSDVATALRTRHLSADPPVHGRSGIKHDCAHVMELRDATVDGRAGLQNGLGEPVDVEPDVLFPLLKGTDLARDRAPSRWLLVPQRELADATLDVRAPRAHAYLERHADRLAARRSSIYRGRVPYAVFGVGPYSFAPWKVAISGLHKALAFRVVGPHAGRPVVLDDTCAFLPFDDEPAARDAHARLSGVAAREFLQARVFWDAKRPVTSELLSRLDHRRVPP